MALGFVERRPIAPAGWGFGFEQEVAGDLEAFRSTVAVASVDGLVTVREDLPNRQPTVPLSDLLAVVS